MNRSQLRKLDVPEDCHSEAIELVKILAKSRTPQHKMKETISSVLMNPESFKDDAVCGELARSLIEVKELATNQEPCNYDVWGELDSGCKKQMDLACSIPVSVRGAVMPDNHLGFGVPIGGVLALDNAVSPYAVGVDIACRMKLSVLDIEISKLQAEREFDWFRESIEKGTQFGVGASFGRSGRQNHKIMDDDRWDATPTLKDLKNKAWEQLGTSGSGNHFVEYGVLTLEEQNELNLKPGSYVALLSHSGSRGPGAKICQLYSNIAKKNLPARLKEKFSHLAWLELGTQEGDEYWLSMNLMGDYASANHDVIHKNVSKNLGSNIIGGVENHHNFAWLEEHDGNTIVVHRKGATPAGKGVLGVIPGSMGSPAFVVRGKGNEASLSSASHGAGRVMSRKQAKQTFNFNAERKKLEEQGIRILSAGADEVPGVYKPIEDVMNAQKDLVEPIARFDPKIVKMCDDGSRAED